MFVCLEVQAKRAKTKRNVLVSDETSMASKWVSLFGRNLDTTKSPAIAGLRVFVTP